MDRGITITIEANPQFWLKHLEAYENITEIKIVNPNKVNEALVRNIKHIVCYWRMTKDDSILREIILNCPIGLKLRITYENINALGA